MDLHDHHQRHSCSEGEKEKEQQRRYYVDRFCLLSHTTQTQTHTDTHRHTHTHTHTLTTSPSTTNNNNQNNKQTNKKTKNKRQEQKRMKVCLDTTFVRKERESCLLDRDLAVDADRWDGFVDSSLTVLLITLLTSACAFPLCLFNPFTATASRISGLKYARTRLQAV